MLLMVTEENVFEIRCCMPFSVSVYLSFVLLSLIFIGWDMFCFVCKNYNRCNKDYKSFAVYRDKPNETITDSVMAAGLHQ